MLIVAGYKLDMRACLQHMSELDQIPNLSAMLTTNSATHHTVVLLRTVNKPTYLRQLK